MLNQDTLAYLGATLPVPSRYSDSDGSKVIQLVAGAQAALDHDLRSARRYLDQLAAIFSDEPRKSDVDEALLLPKMPKVDTQQAQGRGGLVPWQLQRVVAHIDRHLAGSISMDELAGIAKLSRGYFCQAFKQSVGETPHLFLIRQRVRRAQILMLTTSDTLSQIACASGLADQSHMTRLFNKLVGETPLYWRRQRQQGYQTPAALLATLEPAYAKPLAQRSSF